MDLPGGDSAPPPPPGGWMGGRRGAAGWVSLVLAGALVLGRFLPGPVGDAWTRATERIVGTNWLDRPAVARALDRLPAAGALRAAILGPGDDAPAASRDPGAAGQPETAAGPQVGDGALPALGPVGDEVAGQPGNSDAGAAGAGGTAGDLPAAGDDAAAGAGPPGGTGGDTGPPAPRPPAASGEDRSGTAARGPAAGDGGAGEDTAPQAAAGEEWEPEWIWPVSGKVSQPFGWQLEEGGNPRFHDGIDIDAAAGTGVRAAADGIVLRVWHDAAGLGWTVEVDHRGGWVARYAGVDHVIVRDRDVVRAGQVLAAVAAEAEESQGPHLHFELRRYGQAVDPELHLPARDGKR